MTKIALDLNSSDKKKFTVSECIDKQCGNANLYVLVFILTQRLDDKYEQMH